MKNKLIRKYRDRAGETIAETLVALLISALALTMLAGSITTATKVAKRSEEVMMQYYAVVNRVMTGAEGEATDKFKSGQGNIIINIVTNPESVAETGPDSTKDVLSGSSTLTTVNYRVNSELAAMPIAAYSYETATGG